jgi:hypothetical protein
LSPHISFIEDLDNIDVIRNIIVKLGVHIITFLAEKSVFEFERTATAYVFTETLVFCIVTPTVSTR